MEMAAELSQSISTRKACRSLGLSRASLYRQRRRQSAAAVLVSANALTEGEAYPQAPLYGNVSSVTSSETSRSPRSLSPEERQAVFGGAA